MSATSCHIRGTTSWSAIDQSTRSLSAAEAEVVRAAPRFHPRGWQVTDIPVRIHAALRSRFFENRFVHRCLSPESTGGVVHRLLPGEHASLVAGGYAFGDQYYAALHSSEEMRRVLEAFVQQELEPTFWYGPRLYLDGAVMERHIDQPLTHLVSATLMIEGQLDVPWPIYVETDEAIEEVHLEPGEMLLYEGARLPHYRPSPLKGEYVGIFFHYRPKQYAHDAQYLEAISALNSAAGQRKSVDLPR